jgi:hypothetical protein
VYSTSLTSGQPAVQTLDSLLAACPVFGDHLKDYIKSLSNYVEVEPPKKTQKKERPHLSDFPGLRESFRISVDPDSIISRTIEYKAIDQATRRINLHEAVAEVARLYIQEAEWHDRNEERNVDIWIIVVPELVYERCKPEAQRRGVPLLKGDFGRRQQSRENLPLLAAVIDQKKRVRIRRHS